MEHQKTKFTRLFLFLVILGFISSCYYDKEEELYPQGTSCDTLNVTYSGTISNIMVNNCNGCHNSISPSAGIVTDNYDDLKVYVDNGRFWGAVSHAQGFSPMPQNAPKLSDCNLEKIKKWLDDGAPNN